MTVWQSLESDEGKTEYKEKHQLTEVVPTWKKEVEKEENGLMRQTEDVMKSTCPMFGSCFRQEDGPSDKLYLKQCPMFSVNFLWFVL